MIELSYTKKQVKNFIEMQATLQENLRYRGQINYSTDIKGYEGKNMMQVGFAKREEVKFKNEI